MTMSYHPETLAVRAAQERSPYGEHAEAMFLTSSFTAENAAQAAARFQQQAPGYTYTRVANPTSTLFHERLAAMEGAEAGISSASGMSAILALCIGHLKAGDHVVASSGLFGSTILLFSTFLTRFGVQFSFAKLSDPAAWRAAVTPHTRLFFLETPSNPLLELGDIAAIAEIAHAQRALLVVDNSFCSPILQQPLKLGADLVMHSGTKYIDGQGRVHGGAVLGSAALIEPIYLFSRTGGTSLSPFNAWVLLKGLETLSVRMRAHCAHALEIAQWLEAHPAVAQVYYPGLPSHPQYALAQRQQQGAGGVVSFEVKGDRTAAWQVVDRCRLFSITANLGDTKSTITHPATTTHGRVSAELRAAAGIRENLLRLSIGLEHPDDLKADLSEGLRAGH